ncbi:hypothetical protein [Legionella saoudiensis]|uniref:hypothetical protein n=1 Tax=Legionella saoudiensis TaxID=1750561 RepID=UPI0007304D69|nr:hypothetical protein [Legionella saoudiensis]
MNKFKIAALSTLLLSGLASANPACDSFQLRIKNNLAEDLAITKISLTGAKIQPGHFEVLKAKTEQVFTVNSSNENVRMDGEFNFHTISLPSKSVKIRYSLINSGMTCEHKEYSPDLDYAVEKTRNIGEVSYTISNK